MSISKNPQNRQERFIKFTEKKAREWFKKKRLSPSAYLLLIWELTTPPDKAFVIPNVRKFCKQWKIPRASFYRAIEILKNEGEFYWEATHGIVLKPFGELRHLSQNETVSQVETLVSKADRQSQKRTDSLKSGQTVSKADTDIYKDREREDLIRSRSDLDQISPLTPQGEPEGVCVPVEFEILDPEPELVERKEPTSQPGASEQLEDSEQKPNSVCPEQPKNPDETKSSAAPRDNTVYVDTSTQEQARGQRSRERLQRDIQSNQDKVDELIEKFESGEIAEFPRRELRLVAGALIGEYVELYRESGDVCCSRPNDIDSSFAAYVEKRLGMKIRDRANAISRIRNCEQSPTRWRELVELVEGWRDRQISQISPMSSTEFDPEFLQALYNA